MRASSSSTRSRNSAISASSVTSRPTFRVMRVEFAARASTRSIGTSRWGPKGPSTSREGICPLRYQVRSADRDTPTDCSASASDTHRRSSSESQSSGSSVVITGTISTDHGTSMVLTG